MCSAGPFSARKVPGRPRSSPRRGPSSRLESCSAERARRGRRSDEQTRPASSSPVVAVFRSVWLDTQSKPMRSKALRRFPESRPVVFERFRSRPNGDASTTTSVRIPASRSRRAIIATTSSGTAMRRHPAAVLGRSSIPKSVTVAAISTLRKASGHRGALPDDRSRLVSSPASPEPGQRPELGRGASGVVCLPARLSTHSVGMSRTAPCECVSIRSR